jgi:hypothetical protein
MNTTAISSISRSRCRSTHRPQALDTQAVCAAAATLNCATDRFFLRGTDPDREVTVQWPLKEGSEDRVTWCECHTLAFKLVRCGFRRLGGRTVRRKIADDGDMETD